jgi:glycosyltransferase involved in cell wall biosynthesis
MTSQVSTRNRVPRLTIGVRAWNEEAVIAQTLQSVFEQSLFEELARRGERCEILCIPNGCTDRTAAIARDVFTYEQRHHPWAQAFTCRVEDIQEAGRNHTWNAFVHELSHPETEFIIIMDSDILFNQRETLFNMYSALLEHPEAGVASDQPIKDIQFKARKSWRDRISLATTDMTGTIEGQMTGQIYCIRASIARRLYLPKDLGIDDGFLKAIICTNFLSGPLVPSRIITAPGASHVYEAYTSVGEVMNNQKRQMIGQAIVHVLLEHLRTLPPASQQNLAVTLREKDTHDPDWLKNLLEAHLNRERHFWRIFPDALTFRFRRWRKLSVSKRLTHLPAAVAGFVVTLVACARARRHFRRGRFHYWPKANRGDLQRLNSPPTATAGT